MHPSGGASAAPGRVGGSAGGGRPTQAPWTPPRHRPASSYGGAARPTHGSARAGGPAGGHGTPGGAPVRRPGVAQGTCDGTPVLGKHDRWSRNRTARPPGDPPRRHQGAGRGPTDPQPPRRPVALRRPQRGVAQPQRVLLDPGGLGPHLFRCVGGRTLQTRHQRRSRRRPHPHVGGGHLGHGARRGGGACNTAPTSHGSIRWTPKSPSTSCDTRIASGLRGSPRARRR